MFIHVLSEAYIWMGSIREIDMRLIAIGILALAGAIMAAAGTIAEALPDSRRLNSVEEFGMAVVAFSVVLFVLELWSSRSTRTTAKSTFAE